MDKKWNYLLRHNKAVQFLSKYLIILIREINEKEILGDILKANLGYDEILIEESSKDIIDINSIKKSKNQKKSSKNTKLKRGTSLFGTRETNNEIRKVELIYFCLLKFKGLIRYMNFQGLKHNDIKKIAYFIKHISFKRGEYIFRQGDKSDALYGVITGKVIIRFVKPIDIYKKLSYENFEDDLEPVNNVTIDYFMSDCEEENSESEEYENDDFVIIDNKKKLTVKEKKIISILDEPDESESERKLREKINELRFKKVANETEDQIDRDIDKKVIWERKRKIDFSIKFKKNEKEISDKILKKKKKKKKKKKVK